ncbi:MAG: HAD family hydrolase [Candidatus Aenigmarchaeota archaeon]|nr:HAD family hydrolase [Candidatus Aenigmarchaeota archaeon]
MRSPILVWDGDGVIFDGTMEIIARVFAESLYHRFGIPIEEGSKYMYETTGMPTARQYKDILTSRGYLPQNTTESHETIQELVNYFTNHAYSEMPPLCPDVLPNLPYLEKNRMVISTNAPQPTLDQRMKYHGLDRYFLNWYGKSKEAPDKRMHKPFIIKDIGVSEDEFRSSGALVGDGYTDMKIAKEWGIQGIGRKTKDNTEDRLIESGAITVINGLGELPELVKRLFS